MSAHANANNESYKPSEIVMRLLITTKHITVIINPCSRCLLWVRTRGSERGVVELSK